MMTRRHGIPNTGNLTRCSRLGGVMAAAMPTARPAAGNIQEHRPMNHDGEGSDVVAANRGVATIRLWQTPSRVWPAYPTVAVIRAASRLGRGRAERRSPAIGGVTVFLDDSKAGSISPRADQGVPGLTWGALLEHSLPRGLAAIEETPCSSSRGRGEAVRLFAERVGVALRPARDCRGCRCNGTVAVSGCRRLRLGCGQLEIRDDPISSECQLGRSRRVRGC
jgi:hypothetical protein